jgi:hypothetical protein
LVPEEEEEEEEDRLRVYISKLQTTSFGTDKVQVGP